MAVKRPTVVVAGVLSREGRVLIGQRQAHDRHGLKWEFPGGKVERHESPKQALKREMREELGVEAEIGAEIARYEHASPGRPPLLLIFLRVTAFRGEPRPLTFEEIRWEDPRQLGSYDFLDGDLDLVRRLARGSLMIDASDLY